MLEVDAIAVRVDGRQIGVFVLVGVLVVGQVEAEAAIPQLLLGPVEFVPVGEAARAERAMDAVRKWKFRAGMRNGKPVITSALIQVTFRLL